jgi:hypothetical protein
MVSKMKSNLTAIFIIIMLMIIGGVSFDYTIVNVAPHKNLWVNSGIGSLPSA